MALVRSSRLVGGIGIGLEALGCMLLVGDLLVVGRRSGFGECALVVGWRQRLVVRSRRLVVVGRRGRRILTF